MLERGYIFTTYFSEKQNSMSVSTDLVAPGSNTAHLTANRSLQAGPIVDFCGTRARVLNLLNQTFILN